MAALLSFLIAVLVLLCTKGIGFENDFFPSLVLVYLFSLLYLSSVLLFGIFMSSLTKSSFQSLVIILAFYLVAVFLLPLTINSAADGASARKAVNYDRNIGALLKEKTPALIRQRPKFRSKEAGLS